MATHNERRRSGGGGGGGGSVSSSKQHKGVNGGMRRSSSSGRPRSNQSINSNSNSNSNNSGVVGDGHRTKDIKVRDNDREKTPSASEVSGPANANDGKGDLPVDHVALSAMLRECADFCERNEFDALMYQCLQDFRAYYKWHLPKKKISTTTTTTTTTIGSGSDDPESDKPRRRKKKTVTTTTTTTTMHIPAGTAAMPENTASTHLVSAIGMTSENEEPGQIASNANQQQTKPPMQRSASVSDDISIGHVRTDEAQATEDGPALTHANISGFAGSQPDDGMDKGVWPNDARAGITGDSSPTPSSSSKSLGGGSSSTNSVFGAFKVPKIHVPLPHLHAPSTFASTSKKNLTRTDIDNAQNRSGTNNLGAAEFGSGWCEQHFCMNCACKVRGSPERQHERQPENSPAAALGANQPRHQAQQQSGPTAPETAPARDDSDEDGARPVSARSSSSRAGWLAGGASASSAYISPAATNSTATPATTATATMATTESARRGVSSVAAASTPPPGSKPAFQRPVNKASSLIANGWIEQQRRSKMRVVWKDVLASLVEARKPGEETTLWIQREVVNALSGKKDLEALHQIPIKWLEEITFLDYSTDNRFSLKVYNIQEEFLFRCSTDMAAMNWVMTLRSAQGSLLQKATPPAPYPASSSNRDDPYQHQYQQRPRSQEQQQQQQQRQYQEQQQHNSLPPFNDEKKAVDPRSPSTSGGSNAGTSSSMVNSMPQDFSQQTIANDGQPKRFTVRELRAICHGAGINTAGMERPELESAAERVRARGTFFERTSVPPSTTFLQSNGASAGAAASSTYLSAGASVGTNNTGNTELSSKVDENVSAGSASNSGKESLMELRSICHGAGINTAGMERAELVAAAEEVRKRGTFFERPNLNTDVQPQQMQIQKEAEDQRRRQEQEEETRRRVDEEARLRVEEEARRRAAEEEARRRVAEEEARRRASEEEARRHAAEEEARRRAEEEAKMRRLQQETEERIRRQQQETEERIRRQQAEAEQRRRAEEERLRQQQQWQQQQQQWQRQQQEDEQRKRAAEQQAAEQRRRQEETYRAQQQWHQQNQQHPHRATTPPQQQWQHPQQQHPHPQGWQQQQYAQHQQWNQQHPHQQQSHAPPPPQHPFHQQNQQQQQHQSAASQKYAKMAGQADDGHLVTTRIKHDILIQWALQPPNLQMLRPIHVLITTIHNVFPPALGVPPHDYFSKWKPFTQTEVLSDTNRPDVAKLTKAVRKLRFFLHPDKLPRDLTEEQSFAVKMLWDITSDAWEEFTKQNEELGWMNGCFEK